MAWLQWDPHGPPLPEAATLVLHSSVLAQGGDVFLLDMGEPVRIKALAEQMVRLSGLSLRDAANPFSRGILGGFGDRIGEASTFWSRLLLTPASA